MSGRLIAIEGIDGSGKATQATALIERARKEGYTATSFSFPLYDGNPFSMAVSDYLNGSFGSVDEVHPELSGLLYACDRFHARPLLVDSLAKLDLVVCDRYVPSNLAHQGAKLFGPHQERLVSWLATVEYDEFSLPHPNLVILLDLDPTLAQTLVAQKAPRDYTELAADIHEAAHGYLADVRELFKQLASREPAVWRTVPVAVEGELRAVPALSEDIWALAKVSLETR